jgi:hypothetical protein
VLVIGARDASGNIPYAGALDELMIFGRELAAHEIRQLYATGSPLGLLK